MIKKFVKDEELEHLIWDIEEGKPVRLMKVERIGENRLKVELENLNKKGKENRLRKKIKELERRIRCYLGVVFNYKIILKGLREELKEAKKKLKKMENG